MKRAIVTAVLGLIFLFAGISYAQDPIVPVPPATSVPFDPAGVLAQEVVNLRSELKALTAKVADLETANANLTSQVAVMQAIVDDRLQRTDRMVDRMADRLDQKITALETTLRSRVDKLEEGHVALEVARDATRDRIARLGQDLEQARKDGTKAIQDAVAETRQGLARLKSELAPTVAQAKEWAKRALARLGQVVE